MPIYFIPQSGKVHKVYFFVDLTAWMEKSCIPEKLIQ